MDTNRKKKLKATGSILFYGFLLLILVLLLAGFKTTFIRLPFFNWLKESFLEIIACMLILSGLFQLWYDDFLKQPWADRDYRPLAMALIGLVLLIFY